MHINQPKPLPYIKAQQAEIFFFNQTSSIKLNMWALVIIFVPKANSKVMIYGTSAWRSLYNIKAKKKDFRTSCAIVSITTYFKSLVVGKAQ